MKVLVFAVSISAALGQRVYTEAMVIIGPVSDPHAEYEGMCKAKQKYPEDQGYHHHACAVLEISQDTLAKALKEALVGNNGNS